MTMVEEAVVLLSPILPFSQRSATPEQKVSDEYDYPKSKLSSFSLRSFQSGMMRVSRR